MDTLDEYVERNFYGYRQRIAELEGQIESLPSGTLHISRKDKYYNWKILMPDGKLVYLKKKYEKLAAQLARKRVLEAELHDLKNKAAACERYLNCRNRSVSELDRIFSGENPELQRLLATTYISDNQLVEAWQNEPYEKSAEYPEQLTVPTVIEDLYVRSKLEANVAGFLYTLKIPSKYEKITRIGNVKIAVDFTALDVRNMREIPIEVFGMMGNEDYRKYHNRKMNTFTNAGYIDGINFLTFHESLNSPLSPQAIRSRLEDFFFKNPPRELW